MSVPSCIGRLIDLGCCYYRMGSVNDRRVKELKDVIAELRGKDDLSENAIRNLYIYIIKYCCVWSIFMAVFTCVGIINKSWLFLSIVMIAIIGFPFAISSILKKEFNRFYPLYSQVDVATGVIESYRVHRGSFGLAGFFCCWSEISN